MQAIAKKKNLTLSDTLKNPEMSKHVQLAKDRLSSLKGADFDRAFATRMAMEHKKVISMSQGWRKNCKDQDVCSLVDSMLPMLQRQAQMADQLKAPAAQGRSPNTR